MFELRDVTAGYGSTIVVREVNIKIEQGEVVALLGPNGAGKSTLLRAAAGLIPLESGTVCLAGADLSSLPPHQRATHGVCLVSDGRAVFPSLPVHENLRLFSRGQSGPVTLEKALDIFPAIGPHLNQLAGTLSGGQQQMLALLRAFLVEPRVVLIDEASMGLAPIVVDQIFEVIKDLARTGISLLVVEQYVTKALALADRAYVLNRGEVVHSGDAATLGAQDLLEKYLGHDEGWSTVR
jgi:branched-chain amino acid transport system ATP-binding protein